MKRREIIKIAALGVSAALLPNGKVYAGKGVAKSPAKKSTKERDALFALYKRVWG